MPPIQPVSRSAPAAYFLPRALHPGAWWLWALGLAVAVSRTTNLAILYLVACAIGIVVVARRGRAPWAMNFKLYVWLAVLVVVLRIVFRVVFAVGGSHVLFDLPVLHLPGPFAAFRLFGPVSVETLVGGLQDGGQLGVMILAVGAANALANPKRLLAAVPGALYEFGTVVVIAISVFPQLAESVRRVNQARRLRATSRHFVRQVMMPVLADALNRSLDLASSMDSRGYGRRGGVSRGRRRATGALLVLALMALSVGLYGLLDGGTVAWLHTSVAGVGVPAVMVVAGFVLAGLTLRLAGRRAVRTRYRPDVWRAAEWLTTACGLIPAAVLIVVAGSDTALVRPAPTAWPGVTWLVMAGLFAGLVPSFLTPAPEGQAQ